MNDRAFSVNHIATVDIYVPTAEGEWVTPLPQGLLLGFHGTDGYVLDRSGRITMHPVAWLRVVSDDNEQPAPPQSPRDVSDQQYEHLRDLPGHRPRGKR